MNVLNSNDEQAFVDASCAKLLSQGFEGLREFVQAAGSLSEALTELKSLGNENTERRACRLLRQLETFEPSVTMIGQVKAGKTSLVNALIGVPDLLPADVNPWTSVVTSVHLHPNTPDFKPCATFQFFDANEWDRLVSGGGRIGELASRAGADAELEKIKRQVAEMREKTRKRLGRKFELMLGQRRDYGFFDKALIERYVCLGEDLDDDPSAQVKDDQGCFADITKSADLTMQRDSLPIRLCYRDTPGVNDTFMMREQITIRAIRDSRICVVVLSAHQALSSIDMALIRLISNVQSRDVVIFVNRVDELPDPGNQIPQIRDSICATLKTYKVPQDVQVVFGSALWALFALQQRVSELPRSSISALEQLAQEHRLELTHDTKVPVSSEDIAWKLSGIPELQLAVSDRVVTSLGATLLQKVGASGRNLAYGLAAAGRIGARPVQHRKVQSLLPDIAQAELRKIVSEQMDELERQYDVLIAEFSDRMERAQDSFLDRATASLILHLETYGEMTPWTYDPAGLRVLLSSSHKVLARKSQTTFGATAKAASDRLSHLYFDAFALTAQDIEIIPPRAPQVPPPVTLGRTIALDLQASWWKRWWLQRRGYKAYARNFHELIRTETSPVITELRDDLAQQVKTEACGVLEVFLQEQVTVFETLARMQAANPDELNDYLSKSAPRHRQQLIEKTLLTLSEYATT